jgi:hypothetical protein
MAGPRVKQLARLGPGAFLKQRMVGYGNNQEAENCKISIQVEIHNMDLEIHLERSAWIL